MSKFGKKFSCWKCSTKFYDMNKPGATCPKCGANPEDDPNKGVIAAASPAFGDDGLDEVDEDLGEEFPGEEEEEDEAGEEEAAPAGDDDEY